MATARQQFQDMVVHGHLTATGIDSNGEVIENVADPVADMDAVNKRYLQTYGGGGGGTEEVYLQTEQPTGDTWELWVDLDAEPDAPVAPPDMVTGSGTAEQAAMWSGTDTLTGSDRLTQTSDGRTTIRGSAAELIVRPGTGQVTKAIEVFNAAGSATILSLDMAGTLMASGHVMSSANVIATSGSVFTCNLSNVGYVNDDIRVMALQGIRLRPANDANREMWLHPDGMATFRSDDSRGYGKYGIELVGVSSGGHTVLQPMPSGGLYITDRNGAAQPLVLGAWANPADGSRFTAAYQQWRISTGRLIVGNYDLTQEAQFGVLVTDPVRRGLAVRLASGQTAPALEIRDAPGTVIASLRADGYWMESLKTLGQVISYGGSMVANAFTNRNWFNSDVAVEATYNLNLVSNLNPGPQRTVTLRQDGTFRLAAAPVDPMDAATKQYVDGRPVGIDQATADARYVNVSGDTMSDKLRILNVDLAPYTSGTPWDGLAVINGGTGATMKVQNNHGGGFSGIEYADNVGAIKVFTGYNNGVPGEFRFHNIGGAAAVIAFMTNGTARMAIRDSGVTVSADPTVPLGIATKQYVDGKTPTLPDEIAVIHDGTGPPDAELGADGDYYLDGTGQVLYGPKGGGTYGGQFFEIRPTPLAGDVSSMSMGVKFKVTAPALLSRMSVFVDPTNTVAEGWRVQVWDGAALVVENAIPAVTATGWQAVVVPPTELTVGKIYTAAVWVPPGARRAYQSQFSAAVTSGPLEFCAVSETDQGVYGAAPDAPPTILWPGYIPAVTPMVQGFDVSQVWPVALSAMISGEGPPGVVEGAERQWYTDTAGQVMYGPKNPDALGPPGSMQLASTTPAANDGVGPYMLGMEFTANVTGQVSAIRFWRCINSVRTQRDVALWRGTTLVASSVSYGESGQGWVEVALPVPVTVNAGQNYTIGYEVDAYSYTSGTPASAIPGLTYVQCRYGPENGYPASTGPGNYFADVVFAEAGEVWPVALDGNVHAPLALTGTDGTKQVLTVKGASGQVADLLRIEDTVGTTKVKVTPTLFRSEVAGEFGGNLTMGLGVQNNAPTAADHLTRKDYVDTKWGMWSGTQAEYDAIVTKSPTVLYVVI